MHLAFSNVNDAFKFFTCNWDKTPGKRKLDSRVGPVERIPEPVTITYLDPVRRVLFNRQRDCNPFFHLYESLWMLAGRNDVAPLMYYNSKIADIASDDGKTFNGAYGYRWRHSCYPSVYPEAYGDKWHGYDQLDLIAEHLLEKPNTRRAVLAMWNVEDDLIRASTTKDVCCNTHAYFDIDNDINELNLTVCNRSNDLVWGCLGANAVHFSILLEYMAAKIGAKVGMYHQFTNDLHVYTDKWNMHKLAAEYGPRDMHSPPKTDYSKMKLVPLVEDIKRFEEELPLVAEQYATSSYTPMHVPSWREPFFANVAKPLMLAWEDYKANNLRLAIATAGHCLADDWRIAAVEWLQRRDKRKETK